MKKISSLRALLREGPDGARSQAAGMNRLWSFRGKPRRISALTGEEGTVQTVNEGGTAGIPVPCGIRRPAKFFALARYESI